MYKVLPEAGYVVVELIKDDPLQKTQLISADVAKEQPQVGKVIAIGQAAWKDGHYAPIGKYITGDLVYFGKWQGLEFKLEMKDHKIIAMDQIQAVIKEQEDGN